MSKYLFKSFFARSLRNILFIVGLLALSTGLSTYVSANQNASVKASTTLNEHWRGAYDILVRPSDAMQPTEQKHGLVESNYLSAGKSGISVQQWKQIEGLEGVDIAAPVATIGYLRGTTGNMQLRIPPPPQNGTFLRMSVEISTTNGYQPTELASLTNYFLVLPPPKVSDTQFARVIIDTSTNNGQNPLLGNQSTAGNGGATFTTDDGGVEIVELGMPLLWTLVAGIDPASEAKLTGLDKAVKADDRFFDSDYQEVTGTYLPDNDGFTLDNNHVYSNKTGTVIPILRMDASYVNLPTSIKVDGLAMLSDQERKKALSVGSSFAFTVANLGKNEQAQVGYLNSLNKSIEETLFDRLLDLGSIIRPMALKPLVINLYKDQPQVITDTQNLISSEGGLIHHTYLPGAIHYNDLNPSFDASNLLTLSAQPVASAQTMISLTQETAFRALPEQAAKGGNDFFNDPVGDYSLDRLPDSIQHPDPLTYVPLGIYSPPLVQLVRDAQGNPLPGGPVTLHPTLNPASFIPGPPLALTNIAAARFFRGDNCIDAIRVRVAGIDSYTPQNIKKVEDVAAEIIKSTGLHVDIVAGSSPQNVLVYIPGSEDGKVAPLGYVQEQWTTLGAAASISSGIDEASILMLGATGLAGLLYLISQSLLSTLAQRRELALLQAVGWRKRQVGSLVIGEAGIVGLVGGVCAVILAIVIANALGLAAPPEQALGVGVVVFLLYLLAAIGPAVWVVSQPIAELLQRGEVALPTGGAHSARTDRGQTATEEKVHAKGEGIFSGAGWRGLAQFAWRNLSRRRLRAMLAGGGVAIATALLMLMSASLVALAGTLRVTLLGQFVGLEVQPYHYIMVGSAIVISILTVADHLAVGVLERRHELALLQAVGWRAGAVRGSLLMEGLWLGLAGGIVGTLVAIGVGLATRSELILSAWWVVPVCFGVMLALCSLSALYAITLTPRRTLVRAMQR